MSYRPPYQQSPQYRNPYSARSAGAPGVVLTAIGGVLAVLGLVLGVALYMNAEQSRSASITSLAKDSSGLSGCVTELNISKAGTFTLFYVYSGTVRVNGSNNGCSTSDTVPIKSDPSVPALTVSIASVDGAVLKVANPVSKAPVSASGVKAVPFRQVVVPSPGLYRLSVSPSETGVQFAVAVAAGIGKARILVAFIVGLLGVVGGVALVLMGLSQRQMADALGYGVDQYGQYSAYPAAQYPPARYPPSNAPVDPYAGGGSSPRRGRPSAAPPPIFDQQQSTPSDGWSRSSGRPAPGARSAIDDAASAPTVPMRATPQRGAGLPPIVSSGEIGDTGPARSSSGDASGWRRDPATPGRRPVSSPRSQPRQQPDEESPR